MSCSCISRLCPLVYPIPDQKAVRIVKLLVEQVVPLFGVLKALLSDRGTNLLSNLMKDIRNLLGIQKLNTTAYHPQCDGMVERFNRTLKTMLHKQPANFVHSVIDTCLVFPGHTGTLPTKPQEKNLHFSCLVMTSGHQPKQLCYLPILQIQQLWLTTKNKSSSHSLQHETWLPMYCKGAEEV